MKFIIEVDRQKIISLLETKTRELILFSYGWITSDGEILGHILGVLHFMIAMLIFILLIVSHTIYPALWLQGVVLFCIISIWCQHVILKVCISLVAEEKLTNSRPPFFSIVSDIVALCKIPLDKFIENLLLAETIAVMCFTLSFIGRISVLIHETYLR
jgi:hypothetical protein